MRAARRAAVGRRLGRTGCRWGCLDDCRRHRYWAAEGRGRREHGRYERRRGGRNDGRAFTCAGRARAAAAAGVFSGASFAVAFVRALAFAGFFFGFFFVVSTATAVLALRGGLRVRQRRLTRRFRRFGALLFAFARPFMLVGGAASARFVVLTVVARAVSTRCRC